VIRDRSAWQFKVGKYQKKLENTCDLLSDEVAGKGAAPFNPKSITLRGRIARAAADKST